MPSAAHTLIVEPDLCLASVLARHFAKQGHRISFIGTDADTLAQLTMQLCSAGIETMRAVAAQNNASALSDAAAKVEAAWGAPNTLIYLNLGHVEGRVGSVDPGDFGRSVGDSIAAVVGLLQQELPAMAARGSGAVLIAGNGAALDPQPHEVTEAATKAALRAVTLAAAHDHERDGVHVAFLTINGEPAPAGPFAHQSIADALWEMSQEPSGAWSQERMFSGQMALC